MTAFTPSNIPSAVTTVERLAAWSCCALAEINPNTLITTSASTTEPVAQAVPFRFALQQTSPERLVIALYLPLAPTWRASRVWTSVSEISTTALPSSYTQ